MPDQGCLNLGARLRRRGEDIGRMKKQERSSSPPREKNADVPHEVMALLSYLRQQEAWLQEQMRRIRCGDS